MRRAIVNSEAQSRPTPKRRGRLSYTQREIFDQLNRNGLVDQFCEELMERPDLHVFLVNGEWGSGKTFFLQQCAEQLSKIWEPAPRIVEFNAWQKSYLKNPLLDLVYCLTGKLGRDSGKPLRRIAKRAGRHLAVSVNDAVANRTMGILNFRKIAKREMTTWEVTDNALKELKEELKEAAEKQRIVVLVDELDRCEPLYALQLIETARHVLAVPNLQVVLAVNQKALEQSIQHTYGSAYDAERYLRRFVDSPKQLPPPPANVVAGYIGTRLGESGRIPEYVHDSGSPISQMLAIAILSPTRSIRDVDVAVPLVEKVLAMADNQHKAPGEQRLPPLPILGAFAVMLIALRLASPEAYRHLAQSPTSGLPAWLRLNKDLGGWFGLDYTEPKTIEYMRTLFVHVVALGGTTAVGGVPSITNSDIGPAIDQKSIDILVREISILRKTQLPEGHNRVEIPMHMVLPIRQWAAIIDRELPWTTKPS
ncbi:MAG: hypothetical protein F4153_02945 [Acidimicrobiia bacterium]|nr:hypothetical protein [Acidimicrobiia bacterium]